MHDDVLFLLSPLIQYEEEVYDKNLTINCLTYLEYLSHSHLIWVPSDWGKHVLVNAGISNDQIQVIPEGVDSSIRPFMRTRMPKMTFFVFTCAENMRSVKVSLSY